MPRGPVNGRVEVELVGCPFAGATVKQARRPLGFSMPSELLSTGRQRCFSAFTAKVFAAPVNGSVAITWRPFGSFAAPFERFTT